MRVMNQGDALFPPSTTEYGGRNAIQSLVTGAGAATASLWSQTKPPEGKVFVTFEALTTDCYFLLKTSGAAAVTTSTGLVLKVGQPQRFLVDPNVHKLIDAIATGAGVVKWYVSSPVVEVSAGKAYGT